MKPPFNYTLDDYHLDNQNDRDYQDNGVLRNNFGIQDTRSLNIQEKEYSFTRSKILENSDYELKFTTEYYFNIHKQIFQDVYPWAGKPRALDTAKGDSLFTPYQFIQRDIQSSLTQLKNDFYKNTTAKEKAEALGEFLGKVNNIHPFSEGNGRTQRMFISQVARTADLQVQWQKISSEKMKQVSIAAHENDFKPVKQLLCNAIEQSKYMTINISDEHLKDEESSYYVKYLDDVKAGFYGVVTSVSDKYVIIKNDEGYNALNREGFKSLSIGDEVSFSPHSPR